MWWMGFACGPAERAFPVTGTVVEVRSPTELVIAHDEIPGFMPAMTMPFTLDAAAPAGVDPGDSVAGTLVVADRTTLRGLRVTAEAAPAERPPDLAPGEPVPIGALFPRTPVLLAEGRPLTLGEGQSGPVVLTFVYTRCPIPEYCPATVAKMLSLQEALPPGARILAITLDPEYDSRAVLRDFAKAQGAVPGRFDFGHLPDEVLQGVAEKAGLAVAGKGATGITHDTVVLVLDATGHVVARHRDLTFPLDALIAQLGGA